MVQNFSEFGHEFEDRVFQAMLFDKKFAEQLNEVFDPAYFDQKHLQFLAAQHFAYSKKYKDFPTLQLLVQIIKEDLKRDHDETLKQHILIYLQKIKSNPNPGDLPYVKDKVLEFCRKQSLKIALENAVDMMQAEKYESIVDVIKKAVMVGTAPSLGHDFFKDYEARFVASKRNCIPTGLDQLDALLNGGLGAGELACIVAGSGVGKSHFLVMLGANALRAKKNVLHYTFELSEENVGIRYDSNFTGINSDKILENKAGVLDFYTKNQTKMGQLFIKQYPTGSATIYTLRAHVERLIVSGFIPDMILIDYADLMRSSRQYDSMRFELKLLYEELRGWAIELGCPVVTASQSNKEGVNSEVIDITNMNESFGKAFTCDVVISLSRKTLEKATGWGRMFLAKNRAGRDGICHNIKIDTAQSKFEIVGENPVSLESAQDDETKATKARLLAKWQDLKKDVNFQQLGVEAQKV